MEAERKRLIAWVVDEAAADEDLRRDLLDKLQALGAGRRGRTGQAGRHDYIAALRDAGFSKANIVEIIEHLYGVSERQIERDLKAIPPRQK
ncbi:hypothetical protein [Pseudomonas indica]|uniref:hypothetical protein n=1 Tax=Pseudomonas indica TaxID=137658 RepID=UPI0023F94FEC|nr:hypothetical protein [Pseudomonas indica]MBU3055840.1 hypothetical protein [Pseudomonas indica]